MKENPILGNLPAPHEHVSISVTRWHEWWIVKYIGTPAQLMAAGVVDDEMDRKLSSGKGGARVGKDGLAFKARYAGRLAAHAAWKRGELVTFERQGRQGNEPALMALPGMRELLPDGLPEAGDDEIDIPAGEIDARFPGISMLTALRVPLVAKIVGTSTIDGWQLRARRVGRRQVPVEWFAIGKVIAPNWQRLLMDQMAS